MNKFITKIALSALLVGTVALPLQVSNLEKASASEVTKFSAEVLSEIEAITNNSESVELISVDELPKGTPFVNFDTIEDFEKAVKELDEENKNPQIVNIDTEYTSLSNQMITTKAASTSSTTDRLEVLISKSWNALKAATQPTTVTVDVKYSYTGSGSTKAFSSINNVTSYSLGFPTTWVQTDYNKSFYNFKKGVSLELLGYNVVGAVIAGQEIGAKVSDEITFNYNIGGEKNIIEN